MNTTSNTPVQPVARTHTSLLLWNVLALLAGLVIAFGFGFIGLFASDGTPAAPNTVNVVMSFGVYYLLFTIVSIGISQWKRSLRWTMWPIFGLLAIIALMILLPIIIQALGLLFH